MNSFVSNTTVLSSAQMGGKMRTITSLEQIYHEYPNAYFILEELQPASCSIIEGKVVALNFIHLKQSILLTVEELVKMNAPSFLSPYREDLTMTTKADILAAIKGEFGK